MNDDEYQHEWNREVVELLERIACAVERLAPPPPQPTLARLTRCCPFCLATWEGTMDEPCPKCSSRWEQKLKTGDAPCTDERATSQPKP